MTGNVPLPNDVIRQIDDFVAENQEGFRSRPEVVKEGLRLLFQHYSWVPKHRRDAKARAKDA